MPLSYINIDQFSREYRSYRISLKEKEGGEEKIIQQAQRFSITCAHNSYEFLFLQLNLPICDYSNEIAKGQGIKRILICYL